DAWKEWNGRLRDDVRNFFRGERGSVRRVADRILGSPEIYGHKQREAEQSLNFITCHDGFTLNDLVSYNWKHNEANGEDNRDGSNDNRSWNCGIEGPTDDPEVQGPRIKSHPNYYEEVDRVKERCVGFEAVSPRRTQGGYAWLLLPSLSCAASLA